MVVLLLLDFITAGLEGSSSFACFAIDLDIEVEPGNGILVGVFGKLRVCFDEGIFNGSTFIGGNVNGATAGGVARLPGKVY